MPEPNEPSGAAPTRDGRRVLAGPALRSLRAAQLRTRITRFGLGQVAFATVFLIGALAYALAPDRHARGSLLWAAALVVLSTFHLAMGLRSLARARRWPPLAWGLSTAAWGVLVTALVSILLRR